MSRVPWHKGIHQALLSILYLLVTQIIWCIKTFCNNNMSVPMHTDDAKETLERSCLLWLWWIKWTRLYTRNSFGEWLVEHNHGFSRCCVRQLVTSLHKWRGRNRRLMVGWRIVGPYNDQNRHSFLDNSSRMVHQTMGCLSPTWQNWKKLRWSLARPYWFSRASKKEIEFY
jgi:hypothetical protein